MGLNVSMDYSYQLENREILKNTAKNILANSGATPEATQKIVEKTYFCDIIYIESENTRVVVKNVL